MPDRTSADSTSISWILSLSTIPASPPVMMTRGFGPGSDSNIPDRPVNGGDDRQHHTVDYGTLRVVVGNLQFPIRWNDWIDLNLIC